MTSREVDCPMHGAMPFSQPLPFSPTGVRMRAVPSMQHEAPLVLIRAINGTDSSLPERAPRMSQRRSQAFRMLTLARTIEEQALHLVTHPASPNGVHTTSEEWQHLQTIRQFIGMASKKVADEEIGHSALHNGLDAPRTRRLIREYYQDAIDTGYFPDDDDQGMRS